MDVSDLLSNWIVSDLRLLTLLEHWGPYLQMRGATLQTLDALDMQNQWFARTPCIAVCSCLYPDGACHQEFTRLLTCYRRTSHDHSQAQHYFQTILAESLQAQMPDSTIVIISRQDDPIIPGQTTCVTGRLRPLLGYAPKKSSLGEGALRELFHEGGLHVRVTMNGPLHGGEFRDSSGFIDLTALAVAAWKKHISCVFVGEWDGSLSASVARGLEYLVTDLYGGRIPRSPPPPRRQLAEAVRAMNGHVGPYSSYYEYASEVWLEKALRAKASKGTYTNDYAMKVGINAACMWFFSRPV